MAIAVALNMIDTTIKLITTVASSQSMTALYIYIYMYICVCVCVCVRVNPSNKTGEQSLKLQL